MNVEKPKVYGNLFKSSPSNGQDGWCLGKAASVASLYVGCYMKLIEMLASPLGVYKWEKDVFFPGTFWKFTSLTKFA